MRSLLVCLVLLTGTALASQEQTHTWKSAKVTASTSLLGDVEVRATADAAGNVATVEIVVTGKTITVPAKWLANLPAMPLASLEIRTERGYDKEPWLYVYFRRGAKNADKTVELHLAVQAGVLKDATIDTHDGKGTIKHETKKVP